MGLAVAAATGAVLPASELRPTELLVGVLAGAAVSSAQFAAGRVRLRLPAAAFLVAQELVWAWLARSSGGAHSPLLAGFLLEIPLAALNSGRRGALLAATLAILVLIVPRAVLRGTFPLEFAAAAAGFVAVVTLLTVWVVGVLERERRALESAHQVLRERADGLADELRLLGDFLDVAMVSIDGLGRVARLNPAGERLLGVVAADMVGRPWQALLELDAIGREAIARAVTDAERSQGVRTIVERPDGRRMAVQAEVWTSLSAAGRRTNILLEESTAPWGDPADPLRRLGEAAACVAHQFRNSLQGLDRLSRFESSSGQLGGPEVARALASLRELSEDVLSLAGNRNSSEELSLGDTVATAVLLARRQGVAVRASSCRDGPRVRARRGALVQGLFNLVDNACRYSPPGSAVDVTISTSGATAVVEIRDCGPGVPVEVLECHGTAPSQSGHGLGLLAARRFIEASGGSLAFEAAQGGGTLCRVLLPCEPCPSHAAPDSSPAGLRGNAVVA